jgi:biopolymer transport protein ExbD
MSKRTVLLAATLVLMFVIASSMRAQESPEHKKAAQPDKPAEAPLCQDDARAVYEHVIEEYRSGQRGIDRLELINRWSGRIVREGFRAIGNNIDPQMMLKDVRSHISRMEDLAQYVATLAEAGRVPKAEATAARYLVSESQAILDAALEGAKNDKSQPVILPPPLAPNKDVLVVVLDKEGRAYIDGKQMTHEQLRERFEQRAAGPHKNAPILIKAAVGCRQKSMAQVGKLVGESGCGGGRLYVTVAEADDLEGKGKK